MGYGLPWNQPSTDIDWNQMTGYLEAIRNSRMPVLVQITDKQAGPATSPVLRFRCYINANAWNEKPPGRRLTLSWPRFDEANGTLLLPKDEFERASLSTIDGDTFFGLKVDLAFAAVVLTDDNTADWPFPDSARPNRDEAFGKSLEAAQRSILEAQLVLVGEHRSGEFPRTVEELDSLVERLKSERPAVRIERAKDLPDWTPPADSAGKAFVGLADDGLLRLSAACDKGVTYFQVFAADGRAVKAGSIYSLA